MHSSLLANVLQVITHESDRNCRQQTKLPPPDIATIDNTLSAKAATTPNSSTPATSTLPPPPALSDSPFPPVGSRRLSHSSSDSRKNTNLKLRTYACGEPELVSASTSGSIQLYLSLQEPKIYLPDSPLDYENILTRRAPGADSAHADPDPSNISEEQQLNRARIESIRSFNEYCGINDDHNRLGDSVDDLQEEPGSLQNSQRLGGLSSTLLRGSVIVRVTKLSKIKDLTLSFSGTTRTYGWNTGSLIPQHIPAGGTRESFDMVSMGEHRWNLIPNSAPAGTSSKTAHTQRNSKNGLVDFQGAHVCFTQDTVRINTEVDRRIPVFKRTKTADIVQSSEPDQIKVLEPGEYLYHFVLAIPPTTTETAQAELGTTMYILDLQLHRAGGPLTFDMTAKKEVLLIRSPPNCLDTFNNYPVNIYRTWSKLLDYEITIPRRYVILGSSLEMKIQFRPLDKIQVHRIKVLINERVAYRHSSSEDEASSPQSRNCLSNKVRMEPPKRLLILDEKADSRSYIPDDPETTEPNVLGQRNLGNFLETASTTDDDLGPTLTFSPVIEQGVPLVIPAYANRKTYIQSFRPSCSSNPYISISHSLQILIRVSHLDDTPSKSPTSKEDGEDPDHHQSHNGRRNSTHHESDTTTSRNGNSHNLLSLPLRPRRFSIPSSGSDGGYVKEQKRYTKRRRFFDLAVSTPICLLSNHIEPESLDLPIYDSSTIDFQENVFDQVQGVNSSVSPPLTPIEIMPGRKLSLSIPGSLDAWGLPLTPVSSSSPLTSPSFLCSSSMPQEPNHLTTAEDVLDAPPDYKDIIRNF
ncbi:hypothetical protein NADFUDRAFT_51315 [Nadsonia fulvescens var. elongata DSM 6958]|uniref:Arrestin C-terminal-like domain-containing protein n=1 Tax=Nadsonia fulvescens var. elongata DSM 6958 TaxID=857566 RepID=A0A1E3PKU0_9ASCO|nr:hypothetical protein NADFUDRAFT_51315 [Nadsonia fulvescens var. elongata DSM 6958]